MIVGKQKPLEEIWQMIKSHKKVLIFGCNTCVAICHEGGNKEAEILTSLLRMKAKQEAVDIKIDHGGIERQCEHEFFEPARECIEEADAVLSLACGAGVQFLGKNIRKKLCCQGSIPPSSAWWMLPASSVSDVRCAEDCILHLTGGICPITRCSKSLMNGPCGGTNKGSCEVNPDIPCAWYLIHERLEAQGQRHLIDAFIPPKSWVNSRDGGPRKLTRPDLFE